MGYERGAVLSRMSRYSDEVIRTPAYCPKAFAGLSAARIPAATKTRTAVINMRPKSGHVVERHIDADALTQLRQSIGEWSLSESTRNNLKNVNLKEADFLENRDEQILEPLLAIAKATSDTWYQRALKAVKFFTEVQATEKNLYHKILNRTYRVFRSGEHPGAPKVIHSLLLVEMLHELRDIERVVDLCDLSVLPCAALF